MRTRDKRYKDYEITRENRDFLLALCRMEKPEVQGLLRQSCEESNDQIAELLYQNLSRGDSYDKIERIPYAQTDFYAYRKKALAIFRDKYIVWLGKGK
uniref:Uncharacterized protein n=1 Tax=Siphoviridae sp. ctc6d98 TaxID=2825569 RepID=A0A8S5PBL5_9CAUD|nr:MAG TPA: hypothetical protein [Siphoviridae sp. ctc6d98]DAL42147.1 MAG TPA_asm: hypothetical protein [Caudoviricetes sp.]